MGLGDRVDREVMEMGIELDKIITLDAIQKTLEDIEDGIDGLINAVLINAAVNFLIARGDNVHSIDGITIDATINLLQRKR